jgi:hypothetical protein
MVMRLEEVAGGGRLG